MARKINSTLNASTLDILNVIRANAPLEYQSAVPQVATVDDIPVVGEIIYGSPALSNTFINALLNRIALVRIQSATFNNPYRDLKKGYLDFGETVENIFVEIARVRALDPEKAPSREFARTIPDVRSVFHVINWKVQYPLTISDYDLRTAFRSADGLNGFIAKLVDSIYKAAEYDEFLLFKYMLIKAISHGKIKTVAFDSADHSSAAIEFRGKSNLMTFLRPDFNEAKVKNDCPKERQQIFMDSKYNAEYDVKVLSAAFNMEKADFMGRLRLIDDFTTFDNERWNTIRAESNQVEEVTAAELAVMANVKAVLIDEDWFQIYDHYTRLGTTPVNSGDYWNYFYNMKKDVSHSPFANAIAFVDDAAAITPADKYTAEVVAKDVADVGTVITLNVKQSASNDEAATLKPGTVVFKQTLDAVQAKVAVQRYGVYIYPANAGSVSVECEIGGIEYTYATGTSTYTAGKMASTVNVGDTLQLVKKTMLS